MLKEYRDKIDDIDLKLVNLLNERFEIAKCIGEYKNKIDMHVVDKNRENNVIKRVLDLTDTDKIKNMESIYKTIISESVKYQNSKRSNKDTILVLNGPNINMLGSREKDIYGSFTMGDLQYKMIEYNAKLNCKLSEKLNLEFYQSNSESEIIDILQGARDYKAVIINPAAYTHTSVAILDALIMLKIPKVEVHISDIKNREDFRKIGITSKGVDTVISGYGINSYLKAIDYIRLNNE